MNRLTFKQRGMIDATQSTDHCPKSKRDTGISNLSAIVSTRKAFASDRTSGQLSGVGYCGDERHARTGPRTLLTAQGFMMHLTIPAADVTKLRHRVIGTCGELVLYMRIQPLHHASKMRIWILLQRQEFDFVRRVIQSGITDADFVYVE